MHKLCLILFITAFGLFALACQQADTPDEEGVASSSASTSTSTSTSQSETEKPVQHLKVPDITSEDKAIKVMQSTTQKLKTKTQLDLTELNDIHMITYSLEKAVAYFVEHRTGDAQSVARDMAEVVERIHLNSENGRTEETREALQTYFKLEEAFSY